MRKYIALVSLILIFVVVNVAIVEKENLLRKGRVVYLELAPVDPRSLMQGDYMALNFQLVDDMLHALRGGDQERFAQNSGGRIVVALDSRSVATFRHIDRGQLLQDDEVLLSYRLRDGQVKIATNAFFFQEGQGALYEAARFGRFRVSSDGDILLEALYDERFNKL